MKKLLFALICVAMVSSTQALTVYNGDFETWSQAGTDLNLVDITGWFDDNVGNFWDTAWQTNASWITTGGDSEVVFSGNAAGAFGNPSDDVNNGCYIYQSIGTAGGQSMLMVRFEWGSPNDSGAGDVLGMTVGVYAYDGVGTFVAQDAADCRGADGVTLLNSASFTRDGIQGGGRGSYLAEIDISAAGDQELFLRFNNYNPAATGGWPVLDNIVFANIENNSPANGAIMVPVDLASAVNDLTFTVNDPSVVSAEVYLTVNDPNQLELIKTVDIPATGQYAVALDTELAANLAFNTTYSWKVIGKDASAVAIEGPTTLFTTMPEEAVISAVSPAYQAVDNGADAVMSVTAENAVSYQWYKAGETAVPLVDGADFSGATTTELTILGVEAADEGTYYCEAANAIGAVSNLETGPGVVQLKALVNYYTMETADAGIVPDIAGSLDLTLINGAGGDAVPALTDGMPEFGGNSLYFNNSDASFRDPNGAWGQAAQFAEEIAGTDDLTITCWFKWNGGGAWQRLIDIGAGTTDYAFITASTGAEMRFAMKINNGGEQVLNGPAPVVGEWTYVAVTIGGNTGKMYVNGELASTNTAMTINPNAFPHTTSYIAKSQFAADSYFNGLVDETSFYNYALSKDEIAQDYVGVKGGYVCDVEANNLVYDLNSDCRVDLGDLALLATEWLNSFRIYLAD